MNRLVIDFQENGRDKTKKMLFEDVYIEWFEQYKRTVKPSSANTIRKLFKNNILPKFEGKRIEKFTVKQCQKYINEFADVYVNYDQHIIYLNQVFKYAFKHDYIKSNPIDKIIKPRKSVQKQKKVKDETYKFYTKEELQQLLKCSQEYKKPYCYPLFRLLAFTGMRIGESLALTWFDVDIKNKELDINKTITLDENGKRTKDNPKTRTSKRCVQLDEQTVNILQYWKEKQRDIIMFSNGRILDDSKQHIFAITKLNIPLHQSQVWADMNEIVTKNNLKPLSPHGLRHTHCSLLFAAGVSVKEVQVRLGHTDIKTTMNIYTHVTKQQNQKVIEKLIDSLKF